MTDTNYRYRLAGIGLGTHWVTGEMTGVILISAELIDGTQQAFGPNKLRSKICAAYI